MGGLNLEEYGAWLSSKGVPAEHIAPHKHAAQVFAKAGGVSRSAMTAFVVAEQKSGAAIARVRNLQAAAKYILAFHESALPPVAAASTAPAVQEQLLDLELDLATPPPLTSQPAAPAMAPERAVVSRESPSASPSGKAGESSGSLQKPCGCEEPPLLRFDSRIWAYSAVADLVCYFAVRTLYNGKIAIFVATALAAAMALVSTIVMRIHCDRCNQLVNVETLPSTQRQNFNIRRAKMVGITVLTTALAAFFYWNMTRKTWAERLGDEFGQALYLDWQASCDERDDCGEFANEKEFVKRFNASPPDPYIENFLIELDEAEEGYYDDDDDY